MSPLRLLSPRLVPLAAVLIAWAFCPLAARGAPEERDRHTTTLLPDGRVLVAGGASGGPLGSTALYNPATGTWQGGANLNTPRQSHTATLLPSGKVLVAGGAGNGGAIASAEIFDPATGAWSAANPLATGRFEHTATLLPDGTVLVAGGVSGSSFLPSAEIYDPVTGLWSTTGAFADGRSGHTATLLADGKVLLAGGSGGVAGYPSSAHLYDPATRAWTATGPLPNPVRDHTATLLPGGKVLVAGGTRNGYVASTQLYDPAARTWTLLPVSLTTGRSDHTATLLPNGKVLVTGGATASGGTTSNVELYDPNIGVAGTWNSAGTFSTGRANHTATLLPSGKVLLAGGSGAGGPLTSAEFSSPNAGAWTATGALATPRFYHTATLLPSGKVLVAGGQLTDNNATASAELYDSTGVWSATGALATPRFYHTATLLPNGKVLVAGGRDINITNFASAELYDPATGAWSPTGNLINARGEHTATLLPNGKVLVAGGYSSFLGFLASAELYDPASGTWSAAGAFATPSSNRSATLLADGRVLVAGGFISNNVIASVDLYDPATGDWRSTGSLTTPRVYHTATLLPNGKVLVAAGTDPGNLLASAELYDPATGVWSATGSLGSRRELHTATLLPSGQVLAAGGFSNNPTATELYDPVTGAWSATGPLAAARNTHTATLLPGGKVLVAGGSGDSGNALASAQLYDPGLGFLPAWQPQIASASFDATGRLVLTGTGFRGISSASGGNCGQDSPTNYPVVQLRRLAGGQSVFLLPDPAAAFTATGFTSGPVAPFPGYALATVFVNGIPSAASVVAFADIVVAAPGGVIVPDGGAQRFVTLLGSPLSQTYTVTNTGGGTLTGLALTLDGPNNADFTVTANPAATVPAGGSTTFTVWFTASVTGPRPAALHLANNVSGAKNPYDITLTGHALSFTQDADGDGLNDASEFQLAALGFNWETSQPALVQTYYANANGAGLYTPAQVQALNVNTPLIRKNAATGMFTLTIAVKKTAVLGTPFTPFPLNGAGTSTTINGQGNLEFQFSVPDNAAFFRLEAQ